VPDQFLSVGVRSGSPRPALKVGTKQPAHYSCEREANHEQHEFIDERDGMNEHDDPILFDRRERGA
jgi:hypothetical protein